MNPKDLVKGKEYNYIDMEQKTTIEAKYQYQTINGRSFAVGNRNLVLAENMVKTRITEITKEQDHGSITDSNSIERGANEPTC